MPEHVHAGELAAQEPSSSEHVPPSQGDASDALDNLAGRGIQGGTYEGPVEIPWPPPDEEAMPVMPASTYQQPLGSRPEEAGTGDEHDDESRVFASDLPGEQPGIYACDEHGE